MNAISNEIAIFAGGCFWCTEAIFLAVNGVLAVKSGYIGGKNANPTYEEVCSGYSGHAEAVWIEFDPKTIAYIDLLEIFFATHDPTTMNRQGADVGSQYRSEIFVTQAEQKKLANAFVDWLNTENLFGKKVVTKISEATTFYEAETYHQNYYNRNQEQSYCYFVITPKMEKLKQKFAFRLKD